MAHLFFDLDRTLWHHEGNHEVFFKELHAELGWNSLGTSAQFAQCYLAINDRLWDHIQDHNLGVEYVRARRFALLFGEMGVAQGSPKNLRELVKDCESRLKKRLPDLGQGYDGAAEALKELSRGGHQLHLITNGVSEPQDRKVAALGFSQLFTVRMTSDRAGSYKPSAGIFTAALREAGALPKESWMIGDSLLRDVLGGQAVGMRTAWFHAEDAIAPDAQAIPDLEFRDWRTFPDLLNRAILQ
jgi:putative hydrolase of the HAD superfamily